MADPQVFAERFVAAMKDLFPDKLGQDASFAIPDQKKDWARFDLTEVLLALSYRQRELIKMHYRWGDGYIYTPEEQAAIFKLTPEKLAAEIEAAKNKLREPELKTKLFAMLGRTAQWRPHDN